jgi:hypothetical protein
MRRLGSEVRGEEKTRFEDQAARRIRLNDLGFLSRLAGAVNPSNLVPFGEFTFGGQSLRSPETRAAQANSTGTSSLIWRVPAFKRLRERRCARL